MTEEFDFTHRLVRVWMRSRDEQWVAHSDFTVDDYQALDICRFSDPVDGEDRITFYHGDTRRVHVFDGSRWQSSVADRYSPNYAVTSRLDIRSGLDPHKVRAFQTLAEYEANPLLSYPDQWQWPWATFSAMEATSAFGALTETMMDQFVGLYYRSYVTQQYVLPTNYHNEISFYRPDTAITGGINEWAKYEWRLDMLPVPHSQTTLQTMLFDFRKYIAQQDPGSGYTWRTARITMTYTIEARYPAGASQAFKDAVKRTRFEVFTTRPADFVSITDPDDPNTVDRYSRPDGGTEHVLYSTGLPPMKSDGTNMNGLRQKKTSYISRNDGQQIDYTTIHARVLNFPVLNTEPNSGNIISSADMPDFVLLRVGINFAGIDAFFSSEGTTFTEPW